MEQIINTYYLLFVVTMAYMFCWFLVGVFLKRNDVVDFAWGIGFLLAAIISYLINGGGFHVGLLATIIVGIWSFRLCLHIFMRNRGRPEDYRYREWREQWGKWFYIRSLSQIYIFQGLLMLLVVSPVVIMGVYGKGSINEVFHLIMIALGLVVWLVGFYFEAVGDAQLARFIENPANKGSLMREGLWRFTRHPNYFGEVTQWWGLWIMALIVPYGWVGIIGPITITYLILKVSGIPMLERKLASHPEFEDYRKSTSAFFPLPERKKTA